MKRRNFYRVIELAHSLNAEPAEIVSLGALELLKVYINVPDDLEIYLIDRDSPVEERKKSGNSFSMKRPNFQEIDDEYFMPLLVHDLRMLQVRAEVCSNLIGRHEESDRASSFSSGWKYNQDNEVERVYPRNIQLPASEKSFSFPLFRVFRTYAPINANITKREFFKLPAAKVEIRIDGLYVLAEDLKSINLGSAPKGKIENSSAHFDAIRSIIAKIMQFSESKKGESLTVVQNAVSETDAGQQAKKKTRRRTPYSQLLEKAYEVTNEPRSASDISAAFVLLLREKDLKRYQYLDKVKDDIYCVIDGEKMTITMKQIRDWLKNHKRKKINEK